MPTRKSAAKPRTRSAARFEPDADTGCERTVRVMLRVTASDLEFLNEACDRLNTARTVLLKRAVFHGLEAAFNELAATPRPGYPVPLPGGAGAAARYRGPQRGSTLAHAFSLPHFVAFPDAASGSLVRVVNGGLARPRRPDHW